MIKQILEYAQFQVEKYNFDMIEIFEEGEAGPASLYCSQQCRSMVKGETHPRQIFLLTIKLNAYYVKF